MNADLLVINCPKHGRTGPLATSVRCGKCAEEDRQEFLQLRGTLSLAEEGLANYAQENQELRALLTQAPIAKVTVREGCAHYAPDDVSASLYAPGLPPGEYDLYLMPSVPQSGSTNT